MVDNFPLLTLIDALIDKREKGEQKEYLTFVHWKSQGTKKGGQEK